jgi:hypothetical protein
VQCRSDKISIGTCTLSSMSPDVNSSVCAPPLIMYPPPGHLVWEKDMPCLLQVISALTFTVITVCVQPFMQPFILLYYTCQFPGGGLVPLKHGSGSGLCQSTLRGHHSA